MSSDVSVAAAPTREVLGDLMLIVARLGKTILIEQHSSMHLRTAVGQLAAGRSQEALTTVEQAIAKSQEGVDSMEECIRELNALFRRFAGEAQ